MLTKTVEYSYDADGDRISKKVTATGQSPVFETYLYDGDQLVSVMNAMSSPGTILHEYFDGPSLDQVFADQTSSNGLLWPLEDRAGSVRDVVNSAGTSLDHRKLNSFGSIVSQTGATVDYDQFFSGLAWDADSQLYYARARWYDPTIGKFLGEDPLSFAGGDTNLSRYSLNDPVNRVDRNGLFSLRDVTNFVSDSFDIGHQIDRTSNFFEKAGNFFEKNWENGNIQKTLLVAGTIATGGLLASGALVGAAFWAGSLSFVSGGVNSYEALSGDQIGDGTFSRYLSASAAIGGGFFGAGMGVWGQSISIADGLTSGYEIATGRMIGDGTLSSVLHVGNLGVNRAGVFRDPKATLNQRFTVGLNLAAGAASVASSGDPRLQQSLRSLSIAAGVWNTGTDVLYATQSVRFAAQTLRPTPPMAQSSGGALYSVSDNLPAPARRSRRSSYNPDVDALFSGESQFTDGLMMTDPSVLDEPIFSTGDYGAGVGFASMNAGSVLNRETSVFEQLDRNLFDEISMLYSAIDAARGLKQSYNDDSRRLAGSAVDPNYRNATALLERQKSRLYALTGERYSGDGKGYRNQLRSEFQENWAAGRVLAPSGGNAWDSFLDVSAGFSTGIGQVTSFGTLEHMQRGMMNYGDDILGYNQSGVSYKVGIGVGIGISVATGYSAFATVGSGFAAGGALRTGLQGYAIAGDIYGVGQSSYNVLNAQESWSDGLGFLPMVGAGVAGVRNGRGLTHAPKGARGSATAWNGFDEVLAGGPVRELTTGRIRIAEDGISVVERHVSRFGPDSANGVMIDRLRQISRGELHATPQDLNFYSHELREFVRYRRLGWANGVPSNSDAATNLWRQSHTATLSDYGLPLRSDEFLYHTDALPFIGQ